jgi:hypothetical protein
MPDEWEPDLLRLFVQGDLDLHAKAHARYAE